MPTGFDDLPRELRAHVLGIASGLFCKVVAVRTAPGSFFDPVTAHRAEVVPRVDARAVEVPLPAELARLYRKYPPDASFVDTGRWVYGDFHWIFLSEREVHRRWRAMVRAGQTRIVVIALAKIGPFHDANLSYDPQTDTVFVGVEGGAHDVERRINAERRERMDVGARGDRVAFRQWWPRRYYTGEG